MKPFATFARRLLRTAALPCAAASMMAATLAAMPASAQQCTEQAWQPPSTHCSGASGSRSADFTQGCVTHPGRWVEVPVPCPGPQECSLPNGETIPHGEQYRRYSHPGDANTCDACRGSELVARCDDGTMTVLWPLGTASFNPAQYPYSQCDEAPRYMCTDVGPGF